MSKKSLFAGLLFAAVLAVANASGASAGEVKGTVRQRRGGHRRPG